MPREVLIYSPPQACWIVVHVPRAGQQELYLMRMEEAWSNLPRYFDSLAHTFGFDGSHAGRLSSIKVCTRNTRSSPGRTD